MRHLHFTSCTSTQDLAKEFSRNSGTLPFEDVLVSAEWQTLGKGRGSRIWESRPGGLYFSFSLKEICPLPLAALEVGVLIREFAAKKTAFPLYLKWPNDLMREANIKVGGILGDVVGEKKLLMGIGINWGTSDYNAGLGLEMSKDGQQKLPLQIVKFIQSNRLAANEVIEQFEKHCIHLNSFVSIDHKFFGTFLGIGKNGAARVERNSEVKEFLSGSLFF